MKKMIIFLIIIFKSLFCYTQNYQSITLKEQYERCNQQLIDNYSLETITGNEASKFGDGLSKILDSYITMYETTKDKAYLYKFIIQSLYVMESRKDYINPNDPPLWIQHISMYLNGYIISSFSHFVYLIKINPSLRFVTLYPFSKIISNNFNIQFANFGQYADWLGDRVCETLNWLISKNYWKQSVGFCASPFDKAGLALNMQVGFSTACMFIGLSTSNTDFINKSKRITELIKQRVVFKDRCENINYNNQMLIDYSNNSYWWYHCGWSVPKTSCLRSLFFQTGKFQYYIKNIEDISHGAIDVWHILYYYKYLSNIPITEIDLIKLHNTYTQNINKNGEIFMNVKGEDSNNDVYNLYYSSNYLLFENIKKSSAIAYMPLYKYDGKFGTYGSVYNLTMYYYTLYYNDFINSPSFYDAQTNRSHSFLVEAQWDKFCPNLTLYNRKVVYDQDFYSKGVLTVAPEEAINNSYAEPISSEKTFVIKSGVSVNMSLAKKIVFKKGFKVEQGAKFRANIDNKLCDDKANLKDVEFMEFDNINKQIVPHFEKSNNPSFYETFNLLKKMYQC